jgi:hypothetical protein
VAMGAVLVTSSSRTGAGAQVGGGNLAYWVQVDFDNETTVPAGTVTSLSTTVGSPTSLAATATTYGVDATTHGDAAVRWNFTETTSAPVSTEVELTFTIATGTNFAKTTEKVYLETRATAPGAPITFSLLYDVGSTTAPVLDSSLEISQQCSSVGTCP